MRLFRLRYHTLALLCIRQIAKSLFKNFIKTAFTVQFVVYFGLVCYFHSVRQETGERWLYGFLANTTDFFFVRPSSHFFSFFQKKFRWFCMSLKWTLCFIHNLNINSIRMANLLTLFPLSTLSCLLLLCSFHTNFHSSRNITWWLQIDRVSALFRSLSLSLFPLFF